MEIIFRTIEWNEIVHGDFGQAFCEAKRLEDEALEQWK